jgi:hypothetical protein
MDATVAGRSAGRRRVAPGRVRQFDEPRTDSGERPHKAARPQQLPPQTPARGQKTVQPLLVHLVPMQQPIGGPLVKGGVLDVLADDPGALLVPAAEETAAIMAVRRRLVPGLVIVLVCHGNPLSLGSPDRPMMAIGCRSANGPSLV